jgi:hypothetical protein
MSQDGWDPNNPNRGGGWPPAPGQPAQPGPQPSGGGWPPPSGPAGQPAPGAAWNPQQQQSPQQPWAAPPAGAPFGPQNPYQAPVHQAFADSDMLPMHTGSFGLGFAAGFFGGCIGWILVAVLAKGAETKKGAGIGFGVAVAVGVVLRVILAAAQ